MLSLLTQQSTPTVSDAACAVAYLSAEGNVSVVVVWIQEEWNSGSPDASSTMPQKRAARADLNVGKLHSSVKKVEKR